MKVEISAGSNPTTGILFVYSNNTRPCAIIYEEDFQEILSDAQIKRMDAGQIFFNVKKSDLIEKSKQVFNNNF